MKILSVFLIHVKGLGQKAYSASQGAQFTAHTTGNAGENNPRSLMQNSQEF